ncbi:fatty acid synthase-like protein [Dothistroma septosporum NZE10]|uniref:Fatty acid synthase alpha subunit hexA n=1 Tax=Dothistroma septosporum (strain NZE10 / CBS 128990) TaxID=675120 RepID=HEXA_DOTSN|nr:RecName: Full=Fatty acid synthase alpha subunit hexA; Includes: RecName: Full=3-oxoacyl-[acyl-carrier-protein] reductase; AltName: Full=Beta-ketoacyl reductase; Includes: RecName: Full=3-oxoacyl-[acyl-carrier-protein] synthase; AltName: Full=Dothistromin biosynthesis protein hexA [Dothistroma septosporum NZE10]EME39096.1 fatty acid synthase-like protein [Dothistroma septosporum NZE10]
MGQKTIKRKIQSAERPAEADVAFLASTQHSKDLCYEYDAPEEVAVEEPVDETPAPETAPERPPLSRAKTAAVKPQETAAPTTATIADVPLSAEEIVRALVARKLKKPILSIPTSKSVKELCNGKSTLQNEIVGDFHSEFTNLPDRPEDIPLKELVPASQSLMLGRVSSALLSKLVSSKMPARFNADAIGKYLASKWGLGPLRSVAVMLFAIAAEPEARLGSVAAAEKYLDDTAAKYAEWAGITLQERSTQSSAGGGGSSGTVDPTVLAELTKTNTRLAKRQFQALAEYLQVDLMKPSSEQESEALAVELQQKLDAWTAEFSEEFLAGVAPTFSEKKSRRYNAWWNAARQDVLALFSGNLQEDLSRDAAALEAFLDRLSNRAGESLLAMTRSLSRRNQANAIPGLTDIARRAEKAISSCIDRPATAKVHLPATRPRTTVSDEGDIKFNEVPRPDVSGHAAYADVLQAKDLNGHPAAARFVSLKSAHSHTDLTNGMLDRIRTALDSGMSFAGKNILITGAGQGSIGAEVVRILLTGGARVIVTTSREPSSTAKYFQQMYEESGAKGSELILTRFNQASAKDCENLVDHIYDSSGLDRDLDAVLPFAAAPEGGTEIQDVGAKNELVHRLMLASVFRMLGRVIKNKRDRSIDCHPTQVLLPLSPNHGTFGGDGMYAESKLGLESLVNRVQSESWSDELAICGVKIGWTRGTGLMNANDIVAEAIEDHGVLTFSVQEMAFNIAMLMTPELVDLCENAPLMADFGGGLSALEDCAKILSAARTEINTAADVARAVKAEDDLERAASRTLPAPSSTSPVAKKSMLRIGFPRLPDFELELSPLEHLRDIKDPSETVVVVGFSELGPWGSARLRWEIESKGDFSQVGYMEMAWMMDLIKHVDGPTKNGYYVGWVDSKTGESVHDAEIEARYGEVIRKHSGIRFVDPEGSAGYDPSKKEYLHEVAVEEDLPEFEASSATAEAFRLRHGTNVSISPIEGTENCRVQVKRGASIKIPKSVPFTWGSVAGQLPKGWSPKKYGIPEDLIPQLDPVSLYTICCVAEAFYSAGITDPLEIFKYIHLSEIGNFLGSSMGGALKTRQMYRDIYLDKDIQSDVLQETYLNTTGAWVNMLLLGSTGPIKTPMGACATGVESIDSAFESIMSDKTRMCIVGGFDDFHEDESYGFSTMKATVNVEEELAKGRLPSEMSRPTAESRSGFVEAHGCGVQILCRGDVALEMGLPVYGIIAGSTMAADKVGRSVPAPGQGILTFARETGQAQLDKSSPSTNTTSRTSSVSLARRGATVSPLRASLDAWGLTIDDLDVASLHGTSTKANDLNEPEVICKQMDHLGRTPGRPLWAICQKSVTGHPKAPAAAWMLNGCLQVMDSRTIPANRNADNVDPALQTATHLCFPTRPVRVQDVRAFILTSFGFGQKGGQVVGVAPKYFFATLDEEVYKDYSVRVTKRSKTADRAYAKALMSNAIVKVQDHSPYEQEDQSRIFMDPLSRITEDAETGSYHFDTKDIRNVADVKARLTRLVRGERLNARPDAASGLAQAARSAQAWIEKQTGGRSSVDTSTVGIDLVDLSAFSAHENETFIERNFTEQEKAFAKQSLDQKMAFASRWAAKEAVFKCLHTQTKGAGAAMKDIEIVKSDNAPKVKLHNDCIKAGRKAGLEDIQLSISHGEDCLIAVAIGIAGNGPAKYTL